MGQYDDKEGLSFWGNWTMVLSCAPVYLVVAIFLIAWAYPLKFWLFRRTDADEFNRDDDFAAGTDIRRRVSAFTVFRHINANDLCQEHGFLTYSEALKAQADLEEGRPNVVNEIVNVEVHKYIPEV